MKQALFFLLWCLVLFLSIVIANIPKTQDDQERLASLRIRYSINQYLATDPGALDPLSTLITPFQEPRERLYEVVS